MARGLTVKKDENFSEWYTQICSEEGADLADIRYGVQGAIAHKPWAFRILRRLYELLEEEVEDDGHEPMLLPTMIQEENLNKEKEHAGFSPEVFWITEAGDKKIENRLALRPTGETQIYPMYALWIRSYNQLPFKRYQSRITVFRNEMTTRPFLRGREFMFFETHDVFKNHENALKQIDVDMKIMKDVIEKKLKIPFLFMRRPSWDKFKGANDTYTSDTLMPDGRNSQLSSTHDLGTNFAKAFDVKFIDENNKEQYGWQTCFGPGIWRIMAALIGIHGDDKGLILPSEVAPYQIVIVPILFANKEEENKKVLNSSEVIKEKLHEKGYRIFIDKSDNSPGYKFNEWELKGVPLRIEIGPKDVNNKSVVISRRNGEEKKSVKVEDIEKVIDEEIKLFEEILWKNASKQFKGRTKQTTDYNEMKKLLEDKFGYVKAPLCSIEKDGEPCGNKIKEDASAVILGTEHGKDNSIDNEKCICCGKPAKYWVYVSRSY